jgi:hypothetical protein
MTFTTNSVSGKTIIGDNNYSNIMFWLDENTGSFTSITDNLGPQSGTFDIAQVQLEEGSIASTFAVRPITNELSLCQRYYQINPFMQTYTAIQVPTTHSRAVSRPVKMRASPTSNTITKAVADVGCTSSVGASTDEFIAVVQFAATVSNMTVYVTVASDAEL